MSSWIKYGLVSLAAHSLLAICMDIAPPKAPTPFYAKVQVQVRVVEKEPETPKIITPPQKTKLKAPPKKQAKRSERKVLERAKRKVVEAQQGLTKQSLVKDGKGPMVPVGNTLMVEDTGKRLAPEDIKELDEDLSVEAVLIRSSVQKPEYTPEALDVGLEGIYKADVFVDEKGEVVDVELADVIGYGMDDRIMAAARQAKFNPRKNRYGKPIAGWTTIKFSLVIN